MKATTILKRLGLPIVMAGLLVLALAYWWLGNLSHEVFGVALFVMLAWHIQVNGAWFRALFQGRYSARRSVSVFLHLCLIVGMIILLLTSIAISQSVFAALPLPDPFSLRQIHVFTSYWVMIGVGAHVGLHWTRVMVTVRTLLRLSPPYAARTIVLRTATALIFAAGLTSIPILDLGNKLKLVPSMVFWDFTTSVSPFFWHWISVMCLPAIVLHYGFKLLKQFELWNVARHPDSSDSP